MVNSHSWELWAAVWPSGGGGGGGVYVCWGGGAARSSATRLFDFASVHHLFLQKVWFTDTCMRCLATLPATVDEIAGFNSCIVTQTMSWGRCMH